jgi:ketosteroid isomerase-like protein
MGPVTTDDAYTYAKAFLKPWNDRDIDRALAFMTDRATWEFTAGREPWGTRLEGPEAIRCHLETLYETVPDIQYELVEAFAGSGFLTMEVLVTGTDASDRRLGYHACDILLFDGDLVSTKRSYRKVVS